MHKWIFWALLFLLPIQLGRHFWPDFAFVFGIRVDYLAPTVYLTDAVIAFLLVVWSLGWIRRISGSRRLSVLTPLFPLFLLILLPSLFLSENQGAAIYKSVKIIEFVLLGIYVYFNSSWILKTRSFSLPLSLAIIYSSAIAVFQFLKQSSLGGVFWFLGERTFTAATPGIALGNFLGQEFLRPYSTLPHPNVLAGFLLVGILLLYPWHRFVEKIAFGMAMVGIVIAFSQGTWLAAFIIFCFWLVRKNKAILGFLSGLLAGGIIFATILPVFTPPSFSLNFPEEIKMRHELSFAAGQMIKDNPFFGVGLNNFINRLPEYGLSPTVSWWLQPVHNMWLLVVAETGVAGLGVFLWLAGHMWVKMDGRRWKVGGLKLALLAILITGIFDHYWLTLQQTQLLATIIFGLVLSPLREVH